MFNRDNYLTYSYPQNYFDLEPELYARFPLFSELQKFCRQLEVAHGRISNIYI